MNISLASFKLQIRPISLRFCFKSLSHYQGLFFLCVNFEAALVRISGFYTFHIYPTCFSFHIFSIDIEMFLLIISRCHIYWTYYQENWTFKTEELCLRTKLNKNQGSQTLCVWVDPLTYAFHRILSVRSRNKNNFGMRVIRIRINEITLASLRSAKVISSMQTTAKAKAKVPL